MSESLFKGKAMSLETMRERLSLFAPSGGVAVSVPLCSLRTCQEEKKNRRRVLFEVFRGMMLLLLLLLLPWFISLRCQDGCCQIAGVRLGRYKYSGHLD